MGKGAFTNLVGTKKLLKEEMTLHYTSLESSVITVSNPPSSSSPAIHETPTKSILNLNERSSSSVLDP